MGPRAAEMLSYLPDGQCNLSVKLQANHLQIWQKYELLLQNGFFIFLQNNGPARRGDAILPDGQCNLSVNYRPIICKSGRITNYYYKMDSSFFLQNNGPARRGDAYEKNQCTHTSITPHHRFAAQRVPGVAASSSPRRSHSASSYILRNFFASRGPC
jgi:hypothetical protein